MHIILYIFNIRLWVYPQYELMSWRTTSSRPVLTYFLITGNSSNGLFDFASQTWSSCPPSCVKFVDFFFLFLLCHSNVCSFSLNLCVHGYNLIIEICWQYHYLWIQAGLSYLIRVLMNLMEQQVWAETHLSRTDAALRPGLCWQTRNQISCWYRNFSECYSFVYVALTKKKRPLKKNNSVNWSHFSVACYCDF